MKGWRAFTSFWSNVIGFDDSFPPFLLFVQKELHLARPQNESLDRISSAIIITLHMFSLFTIMCPAYC